MRSRWLRLRAIAREHGWGVALHAGSKRLVGVDALRRETRAQLAELHARIDAHGGALADHAAAIEELRWQPIYAVHATMAWVEQATVDPTTLVSVVMATKNRSALLPRAIASVQAQSYARFELLIVDDGSEDDTADLLRTLNDERIRVLHTDGVGVAAARNLALASAEGELVAYLDDDNTMHPHWLKSVVWGFQQRPDTEVLYGAFVVDDLARNRGLGGGDLPSLWLAPFDSERLAQQNLADIGAIAHRGSLDEARFEESLSMFSDWDLLARLTAARDPLVLPVIAFFYATDAPHRITGGPTEHLESELVRRRVRDAHGLGPAASPTPDQRPALGPLARGVDSAGPALRFDPWTLDPQALEAVLDHIPDGDPALVECGSGESTIAIGRFLRARGSGHLQSLEHHGGWAAEIRRRVEAEGLDGRVEVIHAPLGPHPLAPDGCTWYSQRAIEQLAGRIDLLVVDGPPAPEGPLARSRYPALPALSERLAAQAVVIVDDAERDGERWVLGRWESEHPIGFDRRPEGGVAIGVFSAARSGTTNIDR